MARNGFKIFDSDTHVGPYLDVLEKYLADAEKSKLPLKQVREVRGAARAVASLDKPVGDDESAVFGDLFASEERQPDEQVEVELTEKALHDAVAELSAREQRSTVGG